MERSVTVATTDAIPSRLARSLRRTGASTHGGSSSRLNCFWGTACTDIEQFAIPRTLNETNIMETYVRSEDCLQILAFIGSVAQVPDGKTVPECRGDLQRLEEPDTER